MRSISFFGLLVALSIIPKSFGAPENRIRVALGMHVNLYHSFRGDQPNATGFGKDIRVIRRSLEQAEELEKLGIRAPLNWDFEHLFSLHELLPKYAPDILDKIKRRCQENKDEIHYMSWNNGLVGAMTLTELELVMGRSKAELLKLFDPKCVKAIVRPQEMMWSPGHFNIYSKFRIEVATLYYSAVHFDGFRHIVKNLTLEEAHSLLPYENARTGEKFLILPTYNTGDLLENTSLRIWAKKLRKEQMEGRINKDLVIYINHDADDLYWEGYPVPSYLKFLPYTGGLKDLFLQVRDLDYLSFEKLSKIIEKEKQDPSLSKRKPLEFEHDLADGHQDGFNSWSEKFSSRIAWHWVQQSREMEVAQRQKGLLSLADENRELRIRLLSTTHFGMATPFLAPEREVALYQIFERLSANFKKTPALGLSARRNPKCFEDPGQTSQKDFIRLLETWNLQLGSLRYDGKTDLPQVHSLARFRCEDLTWRWDFVAKSPLGSVVKGQIYERDNSLSLQYLWSLPKTKANTWFKKGQAELETKFDKRWEELSPLLLSLPRNLEYLVKENFLEQVSVLALPSTLKDSRHFHHHVSPWGVALEDKAGNGLALGWGELGLKSFAGFPLELQPDKIRVHALGTFDSQPVYHSTWGSGLGQKATLLLAEQFHNSAPTFNGQELPIHIELRRYKSGERDQVMKSLRALSSCKSNSCLRLNPHLPLSLRHLDQENDMSVQKPSLPLMLQLKIVFNFLLQTLKFSLQP